MYDYYYGPESEQFAFYRIPKLLFEAERVRDISTDAKLLYGLMLDRMQLSAKNGWLDDNGRVYIYYTVKQIMNALSCSNKTVTRLLNELEGVHLISREKSGFSKPDRIYVMNFLAVVYKVHHETCKKYTPGDVESTPRDMYNLHPNNTDNNKTDISDTESIVYTILITSGEEGEKKMAAMLFYTVEYEAIKAHYRIRLDENTMFKNKEILDKQWKQILSHKVTSE